MPVGPGIRVAVRHAEVAMKETQREKTPRTERAAGQEADRAKAALRNTREGYGRDRSTEDITKPPETGATTPDEIARRHGEQDG
jgi:hypothetical protein